MKLFRTILLAVLITLPYTVITGAEWFDPTTHEKSIQAEFSATVLLPLGDFEELYDTGFGGMIDLSYVPDRQQNYRVSFRTGYFRLIPQDETDDGYETGVGEGFIIPLLLNCEYRLPSLIIDRLKIAPSVAAGLSINRAVFDDRSGTISGGVPTGQTAVKDKSVTSLEPMTLAGINFLYMLNWTDSIFIRAEWGMIYETDTPVYFALLNAGYEKRF